MVDFVEGILLPPCFDWSACCHVQFVGAAGVVLGKRRQVIYAVFVRNHDDFFRTCAALHFLAAEEGPVLLLGHCWGAVEGGEGEEGFLVFGLIVSETGGRSCQRHILG